MKIFLLFLLAFVSAVFILIPGDTKSCGGDYSPYDGNDNSVFAPEIIGKPDLAPLFFSYQDYYCGINYEGENANVYDPSLFTSFSDSINIQDWYEYFDKKIALENVEKLVYVYSLDTIRMMLRKESDVAGINPLNLPLIDRNKVNNALKYLQFAKECEPFAMTKEVDYWEEKPVNQNIDKIKTLLNNRMAEFNKVSDSFLKQRYLYQLLRLFHFSESYKEGTEFYEQNKKVNTLSTNIYFRTLNYVAGCYYKIHDYVHANYYFALSTPIANYNFFHPQEESDLIESVKMCTSTAEKIKIWTWFGVYIDPIRAMKEVFALDKNAPEVELLMVRFINKRENTDAETNWILGGNYQNEEQMRYFDSLVNANKNGLSDFIKTNISEVKNKAIWRTCLAMEYYLNGDFEKSKQECLQTKGLDVDKNSLINKQIRIISFLDSIHLIQKITEKEEKYFSEEFEWLEKSYDNILRINISIQTARVLLSQKYTEQNDWIKSELCISTLRETYESDEKIETMIQFFEKPDLTKWEKYLISKYGYSIDYSDYKIELTDLYSAVMVDCIYKGEWLKARDLIKKSGDLSMPSNAFNIHINDCHDCDHEKDKDKTFSLNAFIAKLISMDSIASAKPENAALNYYLIANGLYNLTFFGNCRAVYQTPVNNEISYDSQFEYYEEEVPYRNERNRMFFDCSLAEQFYLKAAQTTQDNEFAAKCNFMAAKCNQNNFYITSEFKHGKSMNPSPYFENLMLKYRATKFYQQVIKECTYFEEYIKNQKR